MEAKFEKRKLDVISQRVYKENKLKKHRLSRNSIFLVKKMRKLVEICLAVSLYIAVSQNARVSGKYLKLFNSLSSVDDGETFCSLL